MKMKKLLLAGLLAWSLCPAEAQEYKLWYDQPAHVWTEALPLGNGRLGAMVYGNPGAEQMQLNEETIWAGRPNNNPSPEAKEWIPKIRELVFAGKYKEAQDLCTAHVKAKTNQGMPYQTFGDLRLNFPGHTRYTNYYRELSLDSARVVVRYDVDGVRYQRETFTSFPDQVLITRITASQPGKITFNATMTSPHQDVIITSEGRDITLEGVSSLHEGLKGKVQFQGRTTVTTKGGTVTNRDGVLSVENADEAIVYTSIGTNFNNYKDITGDYIGRAKGYLEKAVGKDYADAKDRHVKFYEQYQNRTTLDLGEDRYADVPTDIRVERFKETNDAFLVATYFKFGRYLLICSSQPGGQPANLQGIWNDKLFPSWDCKYTCNINLEMNYWPAEVTNLTELNDPLFRLIREVSETGKESHRQRTFGHVGFGRSMAVPAPVAALPLHRRRGVPASILPHHEERRTILRQRDGERPRAWLAGDVPQQLSGEHPRRQSEQSLYRRRLHDGQPAGVRPLACRHPFSRDSG